MRKEGYPPADCPSAIKSATEKAFSRTNRYVFAEHKFQPLNWQISNWVSSCNLADQLIEGWFASPAVTSSPHEFVEMGLEL